MKACLGNPYSPNVMYFKQGVYNLEILKQVKKVLKKELGGFLGFGAPPVFIKNNYIIVYSLDLSSISLELRAEYEKKTYEYF